MFKHEKVSIDTYEWFSVRSFFSLLNYLSPSLFADQPDVALFRIRSQKVSSKACNFDLLQLALVNHNMSLEVLSYF